jgi:DMATS type aromatic prenyltransferase
MTQEGTASGPIERPLAHRPGPGEFAEETLGGLLHVGLRRLLGTLQQDYRLGVALRVADVLAQGWAAARVSDGPAWPSDITDDHTPFELSVAFGEQGEIVRVLTEPQDFTRPSALSSWALAGRIHERLASDWGADLGPFQRVAELFAPAEADALFYIWHSAVLTNAACPEFKVYLNPGVHGNIERARVLESALERLGSRAAWRQLSSSLLRRGMDDVPVYVSLDLSNAGDARVKVYIAHYAATAEDVASALSVCPGYPAEKIRSLMHHVLAGPGPYHDRPPLTCFAFCQGKLELHSATLHLPVRCYGADDFEIARRITPLLTFAQRVRYLRVLTHLSDRPLDAGRGLQTYVSLRNSPGRRAVTVYLAPEAYARSAARAAPTVPDASVFSTLGLAPPQMADAGLSESVEKEFAR